MIKIRFCLFIIVSCFTTSLYANNVNYNKTVVNDLVVSMSNNPKVKALGPIDSSKTLIVIINDKTGNNVNVDNIQSEVRKIVLQQDNFEVLNRNLTALKQELDIASAGLSDSEQSIQLGKMAGARYLLNGEIYYVNNAYELTLNLVNIETSRDIWIESKVITGVETTPPVSPVFLTDENEPKNNNGFYLSAGLGKNNFAEEFTENALNLALGYQFLSYGKTSFDIELNGSKVETLDFWTGNVIEEEYDLYYLTFLVRLNFYLTNNLFFGANVGLTNLFLNISVEQDLSSKYDEKYETLINGQTFSYGFRVGYDFNLRHSISLDYNIYAPFEFEIDNRDIKKLLRTDTIDIAESSAISINYRYTFR